MEIPSGKSRACPLLTHGNSFVSSHELKKLESNFQGEDFSFFLLLLLSCRWYVSQNSSNGFWNLIKKFLLHRRYVVSSVDFCRLALIISFYRPITIDLKFFYPPTTTEWILLMENSWFWTRRQQNRVRNLHNCFDNLHQLLPNGILHMWLVSLSFMLPSATWSKWKWKLWHSPKDDR